MKKRGLRYKLYRTRSYNPVIAYIGRLQNQEKIDTKGNPKVLKKHGRFTKYGTRDNYEY